MFTCWRLLWLLNLDPPPTVNAMPRTYILNFVVIDEHITTHTSSAGCLETCSSAGHRPTVYSWTGVRYTRTFSAHCPGDDVIKEKPKSSKTYPFSNDTHQKSRTQTSNVFFSTTTRLHESFSSVAISSRSTARVSFSLEKMPLVRDSCFFCSSWNFEYNGVFGP